MCSQAHSLTALVSVSISPDSLKPCEAKYSSCSVLYICYCAYREYKEVLGMCQVFFQRNLIWGITENRAGKPRCIHAGHEPPFL
jgi:hypothetical protein